MTNVLFKTWGTKAHRLCFFHENKILWYINQRGFFMPLAAVF